jgi:hypothetical protein
VWHVSVTLWSRGNVQVNQPGLAEAAALRELAGVGSVEREWWWWNPVRYAGHLRVPLTPAEYEQVPPGVAVDDAGETGPERPRTRP